MTAHPQETVNVEVRRANEVRTRLNIEISKLEASLRELRRVAELVDAPETRKHKWWQLWNQK